MVRYKRTLSKCAPARPHFCCVAGPISQSPKPSSVVRVTLSPYVPRVGLANMAYLLSLCNRSLPAFPPARRVRVAQFPPDSSVRSKLIESNGIFQPRALCVADRARLGAVRFAVLIQFGKLDNDASRVWLSWVLGFLSVRAWRPTALVECV